MNNNDRVNENGKKIRVIGIGPGHPDYVLPIASKMIASSGCLVAGRRHLELFGDSSNQSLLPITAKIQPLLEEIKERYKDEQIGVIVSGDPGFFSFLKTLRRVFDEEELEVYPGISAIQYLFAKGALNWNDGYIASFHGRDEEPVEVMVREHPKVALFTDGKHDPNWVVRKLKEAGIKDKRVLVGEHLSYEDEVITKATLATWQEKEFNPLNVMVIYDA